MSMDPDRYQMRDLKRRMSKLEDQIKYLKTDWKRTTLALHETIELVKKHLQQSWRESHADREDP